MKMNTKVKQFIIGFVMLVLVGGISEYGNLSAVNKKELVEKLLSALNSRLPGSTFNGNLDNCMVTPLQKNLYRVTFRNASFTTDLAHVVDLIQKDLLPREHPITTDTLQIEEVVIIFGPKDNYFELHSIKNMNGEVEFDKSLAPPEKLFGRKVNRVRMSIGSMTYNSNLDMEQIRKSGKRTFIETSGEKPFESFIRNIQIECSGLNQRGQPFSWLLDIEEIEKVEVRKIDADAFYNAYLSKGRLPDLTELLQKGLAVMDVNVQLGKINISIKENGENLCSGFIDHASFFEFAKPDSRKKFFNIGLGFNFKSLQLKIPGNRVAQMLSRFKQFRLGFSIKHLNPDAVQAYMTYIRQTIANRGAAGSSGRMGQSVRAMKFLMEFINSKGYVQLSFEPVKHYFGQASLILDVKSKDIISRPVIDITAKIFQLDNILKKIEAAKITTPATLQSISTFIHAHAAKKEDGNVTIIHQIEPKELIKMLPGKKIAAPTTRTPATNQKKSK